MAASDPLILIICVAATLTWCAFIWLTRGPDAWRLPPLGALLIGAAGSLASSALGHQPWPEAAFLAVLHAALAAAVVGGIQVSLWIREKGSERRTRRDGGA